MASSHWIDNLLLLSSKHPSSYEWFALSAFCVTPRNDCATLRYYKKSPATAQVDAAVRECLSDSPAHNTESMTVLINVKECKFGLFRLRQRHQFRLNWGLAAGLVDTALTRGESRNRKWLRINHLRFIGVPRTELPILLSNIFNYILIELIVR